MVGRGSGDRAQRIQGVPSNCRKFTRSLRRYRIQLAPGRIHSEVDRIDRGHQRICAAWDGEKLPEIVSASLGAWDSGQRFARTRFAQIVRSTLVLRGSPAT